LPSQTTSLRKRLMQVSGRPHEVLERARGMGLIASS
jgi:hypothetical protein